MSPEPPEADQPWWLIHRLPTDAEPWWVADRSWLEAKAFSEMVDIVIETYPMVVLAAAVTRYTDAQEAKLKAAKAAEEAARRRPVTPRDVEGLAASRAALRGEMDPQAAADALIEGRPEKGDSRFEIEAEEPFD